jgi:hypothetical protein
MSISITVDFWCDICIDWVHLGSNNTKISVQRKLAKAQGWIVRKTDTEILDVCPHCQKKDEKRQTGSSID